MEATRRAVERAPCLVSFSGGQDSSLVLAAATRLARTEGLADPIPITWRSRDVPANDESSWQEAVVAELGLRDWVKLETGDALDWVGPVAAAVVARHGVLYPANAHFHQPLAAHAEGGALLTGIGGDQLFGLWRWSHAADVLARRVRATPADALRVGLAWSPETVRRRIAARRAEPTGRSWLRAEYDGALGRMLAADAASEPPSWPGRVDWQLRRRFLHMGIASIERIAGDHDCLLAHPLVDPSVAQSVAAAGGRHGFSNRAQALAALFPALRPAALAARRGKVGFDGVFSREPSRLAAAAWDGSGVDDAIIDAEALRELWAQRIPIRSAMLLQQVTLQGTSAR